MAKKNPPAEAGDRVVARVLVDTTISGLPFTSNQLVELPADLAQACAAVGTIDPHPDAVQYCVEQGEKVRDFAAELAAAEAAAAAAAESGAEKAS